MTDRVDIDITQMHIRLPDEWTDAVEHIETHLGRLENTQRDHEHRLDAHEASLANLHNRVESAYAAMQVSLQHFGTQVENVITPIRDRADATHWLVMAVCTIGLVSLLVLTGVAIKVF